MNRRDALRSLAVPAIAAVTIAVYRIYGRVVVTFSSDAPSVAPPTRLELEPIGSYEPMTDLSNLR